MPEGRNGGEDRGRGEGRDVQRRQELFDLDSAIVVCDYGVTLLSPLLRTTWRSVGGSGGRGGERLMNHVMHFGG